MNLSTPPYRRSRQSSGTSSSLATPSTPSHGPSHDLSSSQSSLHPLGSSSKRRFAAPPRDRGQVATPVGKFLAREGLQRTPGQSPRRVRQRSLAEKAIDWPSNAILSMSTSWELLSFDAAGIPLGIGLNVLHLVLRLPSFASVLPRWITRSSSVRSSRFLAHPSDFKTAEQRLRALRLQAMQSQRLSWGWLVHLAALLQATILSIVLVAISLGNAAYLFTRRRKYHLMLRKDPLASPNARSTTLDFQAPPNAPTRPTRRSFFSFLKGLLFAKSKASDDDGTDEPKSFEVQELDVWTPDYVKWSLLIFSFYPPPLAVLYHFLTPYNLIPFALVGALVVMQTTLLIHSYTHLLSDRQTVQSELMHEYNARFVHPRLFVQKYDKATTTIDPEFEGFRTEYRRRTLGSDSGIGLEEGSVRSAGSSRIGLGGSGRKKRMGSVGLGRRERYEPEEEEEEQEEEEPSDPEDQVVENHTYRVEHLKASGRKLVSASTSTSSLTNTATSSGSGGRRGRKSVGYGL
ncbi:BZ3500_MvSof-1268-A1-R1_Chr4-4g07524 [Microbotryum saponariae]|uniref:BZ3500_MvSof-1268-A1-R1_Chr4-4g07524 protein n=1 Tax=Microbotryum saponariae TaxID=289078 RepID=A0A2X0MD84_9BASI|nr:BZ3500_MvSof-1268-A1-R1_Chr4-4g07524 [Microbotryum saponariae]SDA07185.1 BZ3501_MvSof-1269-A2-R1_Chr4-3g07232 [Microbotryum saponariae]